MKPQNLVGSPVFMSARKTFFLILVVFIPFYFLRLSRFSKLPQYQIPENTLVGLVGRVTQQPYLKGSYQIIHLGPILIKTHRFPAYFYNQKLEIIGRFKKRVINPFQVQFVSYFPTIRLLEEKETEQEKGNLRAVLLRARRRIEKAVDSLLPEPQTSLLLGILFGVKKEMPQEFFKDLQKTGTLHIVVASGQNVTLVAKFLIALLVWVVNRRKALVLAVVGIAFYVLMVGAEAPVVRAGIMATFSFLAQALGREEEGTIALLIAAMIMVLISPLIVFDRGFQLSFAATAGIIWIYPLLRSWRAFSLPVLGESLASTLAAHAATLPILLFSFGQVSPWSPLINSLVLWVVPIVTVLGGTLVFLSLFIRPVAWVLSWFVWLLLTWFVKIIDLSRNLPWVSLELGKLSGWWAVGYYLVLIFAVAFFRFNYKKRSFPIAEAK